jgi:hypothetical protein
MMPMNPKTRHEEDTFILNLLKKGVSWTDIQFAYSQHYNEGLGTNRINRLRKSIDDGEQKGPRTKADLRAEITRLEREIVALKTSTQIESKKTRASNTSKNNKVDPTADLGTLKNNESHIECDFQDAKSIINAFYQLFVRNINDLTNLTQEDIDLAQKAKDVMNK